MDISTTTHTLIAKEQKLIFDTKKLEELMKAIHEISKLNPCDYNLKEHDRKKFRKCSDALKKELSTITNEIAINSNTDRNILSKKFITLLHKENSELPRSSEDIATFKLGGFIILGVGMIFLISTLISIASHGFGMIFFSSILISIGAYVWNKEPKHDMLIKKIEKLIKNVIKEEPKEKSSVLSNLFSFLSRNKPKQNPSITITKQSSNPL